MISGISSTSANALKSGENKNGTRIGCRSHLVHSDPGYYNQFVPSSSASIDLLSKQLTALDPADCGNGAFGVLSQLPPGYQVAPGPGVAMVNGLYYEFTGPQVSCSGGTVPAADQLESRVAQYFIDNLQAALQTAQTSRL